MVDWLTVLRAGAERGGVGSGVWKKRLRVQADPVGGCGGKMAELRALVAVKRVIDYAVKVTGPPSPTSLSPAAMCFRGQERTLGGGLLVTPDLCRSNPYTSKSHLTAKIKRVKF